jgi:hypothetical protein
VSPGPDPLRSIERSLHNSSRGSRDGATAAVPVQYRRGGWGRGSHLRHTHGGHVGAGVHLVAGAAQDAQARCDPLHHLTHPLPPTLHSATTRLGSFERAVIEPRFIEGRVGETLNIAPRGLAPTVCAALTQTTVDAMIATDARIPGGWRRTASDVTGSVRTGDPWTRVTDRSAIRCLG